MFSFIGKLWRSLDIFGVYAKRRMDKKALKAKIKKQNRTPDSYKTWQLWTDGSVKDARGGWGFVAFNESRRRYIVRSAANPKTVIERMELQAILSGLQAMSPGSIVTVYSDPSFIINDITNFLEEGDKPNDHSYMFKQIRDTIKSLKLTVTFKHVKGHTGVEFNEWADKVAKEARLGNCIDQTGTYN